MLSEGQQMIQEENQLCPRWNQEKRKLSNVKWRFMKQLAEVLQSYEVRKE